MIKRFLSILGLVSSLTLSTSAVMAQVNIEPAEPYKVGTFAVDYDQFVGLVMRDDSLIVDLVAANQALELMPQYSSIDMPNDMLGLIEQYEYGLKYRVYELVNWLVEDGQLSSGNRPRLYPRR